MELFAPFDRNRYLGCGRVGVFIGVKDSVEEEKRVACELMRVKNVDLISALGRNLNPAWYNRFLLA